MSGTLQIPAVIGRFNKVLHGHEEHSKTLTVFFAQVLVVNFMGLSQCPEIDIVCAGKPLEALVYQHIVHQKIGCAIGHDSEAYEKTKIESGLCTEKHEQKTRNGKNDKKEVIALEGLMLRIVVVIMEIPHESVHHVFMGTPRYPFHQDEYPQCY
jgi:hypothetical protein